MLLPLGELNNANLLSCHPGQTLSSNTIGTSSPPSTQHLPFFKSTTSEKSFGNRLSGTSLQQTPIDLKEFLQNSQKEFTSLSLLIKQNNDPSLSDEVYLNETSEKIDLIIDDYINSSNEHFYETGTYISPDMWEDLDLCSQILESKN